jgi:hypothetical protein
MAWGLSGGVGNHDVSEGLATSGVFGAMVGPRAVRPDPRAPRERRAAKVRGVKVILLGATGMIGQGVLRECLLDPEVTAVLSLGRRPSGQRHEKLRDLVVPDLLDLSAHAAALAGYDACFFCLGVSSAGMSETEYRRVTRDLTLAVAETLVRHEPGMTFVYVSGAGTDTTEHGGAMWARVKGETENALLRLGFRQAYMFRPGLIQPLHGIRSRTRFYRLAYAVLGPLVPLLDRLFPDRVTTTERMGLAMLEAVRAGASGPLVEAADVNALARAAVARRAGRVGP